MKNMKYRKGDKVKIKSINWCLKHKNEYGEVELPRHNFGGEMQRYCGCVMTVFDMGTNFYRMVEDDKMYCWTDDMIEGLAQGYTSNNVIESISEKGNPFYSDSEKKILDSARLIKKYVADFNYNNDRCNLGICEEVLDKLDLELENIKKQSESLRKGIEEVMYNNRNR